MFDRQDESLLTFRQAAGRLPGRPDGRPFRAATLYRWLRLGVHGVRLEHSASADAGRPRSPPCNASWTHSAMTVAPVRSSAYPNPQFGQVESFWRMRRRALA